jgi:hypothetical protein
MPEGVVTLAQLLSGAGYRTASRVNNVHAGEYFEVTRGFQDRRTDNTLDTTRMVDEMQRWLRTSDPSKSFFFMLFSLDAHTAYNPSFESYERVRRTEPVPEAQFEAFRFRTYHEVMDRLKTTHRWPEELKTRWVDLYDA